ncbi:MAG: hypothetical protein NTX23_08345 [Candidatus Bipolaricaulota bacterium]|nr:hypothetical protein [Candidatus Bipolaricaulota bacterium]
MTGGTTVRRKRGATNSATLRGSDSRTKGAIPVRDALFEKAAARIAQAEEERKAEETRLLAEGKKPIRQACKIVECGLEETVTWMLLEGWSCRAVQERLKRGFGAEISHSTIAAFKRKYIAPLTGLPKSLKDQLDSLGRRVNVLDLMSEVVESGMASLLLASALETKMGQPSPLGVKIRAEVTEAITRYAELEEKELGFEKRVLAQINEFTVNGLRPLETVTAAELYVMSTEDLEKYIEMARAVEAGKCSAG